MERLIIGISRVLGILSALSIVVLMLAVAADVLMRFISGGSLPGMLEVAESSLVVAVFFGLGWAAVKGEHVAVTLVTDRMGAKANSIINVVVWGVSSGFLAWMLFATTHKALDATAHLEERFGLVRWPLYPFRWVIVIGIAVFLLVALLNLARAVRGRTVLGNEEDRNSIDRPENKTSTGAVK
ncbi:TRAP transporter small permease [Arthrobacter koreensis]|uniref:TRAP transporter small permease n=1 Tax=Arthrobacter koreensis TaxID=199136 RepID=UPI0036DA8C57